MLVGDSLAIKKGRGNARSKEKISASKNVSSVSKSVKVKVKNTAKVKINKNTKVKKPSKKLTGKTDAVLPMPEVKKPDKKKKEEMKTVLAILTDSYIRQMLIELGGENALSIVRSFYTESSDEELAKKLKIKISDVRATLNRLHNEGLVNYIRQKDSETGWYSYSWSLNHSRIKKWAVLQSDKFGNINNGVSDDYYFCPSCGDATITTFESASNGDFRCERCNRLLEFLDDKKYTELFEKKRQ